MCIDVENKEQESTRARADKSRKKPPADSHLCRDAWRTTASERGRNGVGPDPFAWTRGFSRSQPSVAGAALWQAEARVPLQAQHLRMVKSRRGVRATLARTCCKPHWHGRPRWLTQISVADAVFPQGQVQLPRQAWHFRGTFLRASTEFMAGPALSQGRGQIHCKHWFRGR